MLCCSIFIHCYCRKNKLDLIYSSVSTFPLIFSVKLETFIHIPLRISLGVNWNPKANLNKIFLVGLSPVFYIANFHIGFSCGFCDVAWRCWDSLKIRFNDECKHIKCIDMLTEGFLTFMAKSLLSLRSRIPATKINTHLIKLKFCIWHGHSTVNLS